MIRVFSESALVILKDVLLVGSKYEFQYHEILCVYGNTCVPVASFNFLFYSIIMFLLCFIKPGILGLLYSHFCLDTSSMFFG